MKIVLMLGALFCSHIAAHYTISLDIPQYFILEQWLQEHATYEGSEQHEQCYRHRYHVRDVVEITINDVEGLGCFIEIALKEPIEDIRLRAITIKQLLAEIGITQFIQYDQSYAYMIRNPEYAVGSKRIIM